MKATDLDILLQEGEGTMLEYKEGLSSSYAPRKYPASTPQVTLQVGTKPGPSSNPR